MPPGPPDAGLLRPAGGASAPGVPAPLDLAQVPFVLASARAPGRTVRDEDDAPEEETDERDAEALERLPVLPPEAWQARYDVRERFGRTVTVRVEGHSRLGMPRGRDLDVLLAVLSLYAEDYQRVLAGYPSRLVDGALGDVSVNEILGAMGVPADDRNGTASRRVRQALRRFGHLKFTSTGRVFRDASAEAAALLAGDPSAQPRVPDRTRADRAAADRAGAGRVAPGRGASQAAAAASRGAEDVVAVEEEVTHLLEYAWRLSFARSRAGELRITRLKLNSRFHEHLVTGWVAWIEAERYRALSSPLARRLYVLLAGEAATGRPAPWVFDLRALRAACGMSPHRYANEVKKDVVRAAAELVDVGVLAEPPHVASPRKGEWALTFAPGPALALAALLRGTSVVDLSGQRAQLAFLHYFGFDAAAARALLAEAPHAVYDALCYALYVREVDPGRVTRSWRGFILERVAAHRPNTGDVGYAAWAAKRLAADAGTPSGPDTAAAAAGASTLSGPRVDTRPDGGAPDARTENLRVLVPCDPAAAGAWAAVQAALSPTLDQDVADRQLVRHLVPVALTDEVLVLGTDLLFGPSTVRRVRLALGTALRESGAGVRGTATRVRIEHVVVGRDGAAPVLRPMLGGADDEADPRPAPAGLPGATHPESGPG